MIRREILEIRAKSVLLQLANIFAVTSDLLIPTKHCTPPREESHMSLANSISSPVQKATLRWAAGNGHTHR